MEQGRYRFSIVFLLFERKYEKLPLQVKSPINI